MSKIDKIKKLATDKAATNGERAAAAEALKRLGINLDLVPTSDVRSRNTLALNEITLIPLAMIVPTEQCIYAPSRITKPMTITLKDWLHFKEIPLWISLAEDGKSDPKRRMCYGGKGHYWLLSC